MKTILSGMLIALLNNILIAVDQVKGSLNVIDIALPSININEVFH